MSLPMFEDLGEIELTDEGLASLKGMAGGGEPDQIKLTDEQVKNLREGLGLSGYDVDAKPLSVKDYAEKNPFSATKDETLTYDQRLRAAIEAQKQMRGPRANVRAQGSEEVNLGGGDWLPHKLVTGGETRPGEVVAGAVRRLPVAGGVFRMLEQREFNSAIDRIGKGKATEQDFHKLASSALDMDQAERASMLKKAGDTLSYIPGFVTEMWLTGGVANVAGQGARAAALTGARAIGGKAGIALARGSKTIGTIGGGIAQGAALPSAVLPTIAQQQQDEIGQDSAGQVVVTDNQTGTGTAIARGVAAGAAEAISERLGGRIDEGLGALGRLFGKKPGVLGNIVASYAAKKIKPSGLGEFIQSAPAELVEERVTEGINLVTGVDTSGGVLGNLARGEFGAAGEQLGVEALAFGTLNAGQTAGNFIDAAAEGVGGLTGRRNANEQIVVDTMTNPKIARELIAAADAAGMGQQLRDMVTVEKPSRRQFASLGLPYLDEAGRAEFASVIRDVLAVQQQQAAAPEQQATGEEAAETPQDQPQSDVGPTNVGPDQQPATPTKRPTMLEALRDSAKEFEKVYGGDQPAAEQPKAKKKYSTWSDKRLESARKSAADALSGLDPSDPQYSSSQREAESIGLEIERRSKKKGANNGEESSDGRQAGEEVNQKVRDQEAQGQVAPATETPPRDQQPDMPVAGPLMQPGGDAESAPASPPVSSGPSAPQKTVEQELNDAIASKVALYRNEPASSGLSDADLSRRAIEEIVAAGESAWGVYVGSRKDSVKAREWKSFRDAAIRRLRVLPKKIDPAGKAKPAENQEAGKTDKNQVISPPVPAIASPAKPLSETVKLEGSSEWAKADIYLRYEQQLKNGNAQKIEKLSADGLTTSQIATDLGLDKIDVAAVKTRLGIPSMNNGEGGMSPEFVKWRDWYRLESKAISDKAEKAAADAAREPSVAQQMWDSEDWVRDMPDGSFIKKSGRNIAVHKGQLMVISSVMEDGSIEMSPQGYPQDIDAYVDMFAKIANEHLSQGREVEIGVFPDGPWGQGIIPAKLKEKGLIVEEESPIVSLTVEAAKPAEKQETKAISGPAQPAEAEPEGFEIYQTPNWPGKWLAPVKRGVRGFGDTIHATKSEAVAAAKSHLERWEWEQERDRKVEEERKAEEARKQAFKDSGMTPLEAAQKARRDKYLDQEVRLPSGKVMTRRALVEMMVRTMNRVPQKFGTDKDTEYRLADEYEGVYREISKTEYEYALEVQEAVKAEPLVSKPAVIEVIESPDLKTRRKAEEDAQRRRDWIKEKNIEVGDTVHSPIGLRGGVVEKISPDGLMSIRRDDGSSISGVEPQARYVVKTKAKPREPAKVISPRGQTALPGMEEQARDVEAREKWERENAPWIEAFQELLDDDELDPDEIDDAATRFRNMLRNLPQIISDSFSTKPTAALVDIAESLAKNLKATDDYRTEDKITELISDIARPILREFVANEKEIKGLRIGDKVEAGYENFGKLERFTTDGNIIQAVVSGLDSPYDIDDVSLDTTPAEEPEPAPPPPAAPAKKPSQMTAEEIAAKVREKMGLSKPAETKRPSPDEPATLVIKPIFGGPETKLELPGKKKSPLPKRDSVLPNVPKEQPAPAPEPAKPMTAKEKLAERARKLREQQEKGDEEQRYKVGTANTRTGLRPVDRAEIVKAFPGRPVQQIPGGWRVEIGSSHVDIVKEPSIPIDWAEVERRSGRKFGAAAKKAIESARGLYSVRLPDGKLHDGLGLIRLREETAAALGQMDPRQRDRLLVDVGNQRVLAHEALHLAKRAGLLTDSEWKSLVDKYARGVSDPYMQEEMIASARERWDPSSRSIWRRILAFIRDLLSAIGVKKTADDVFDLMDTRAFWSREGIPVRRSGNFADEYSRTQDSYSLSDEDSAELVSMAIDAGAEYVQGGGSTYEGWISDLRGAMPDGDLRLIRPSLEQAWGIMRDMFDPGTLGEVGDLETILGGGGDEKDTGTAGDSGLGAGSGLPGGTATGDSGGSPEVGDAGGSPGQRDAADIRGSGGRGGGRSPRGAGIGNADTGVPGQSGEGGATGTERPGAEPAGGVQAEKRNYVIDSDQRVVTAGTPGKIRAAIAALEVLATIERENRLATDAEKATIAAYPGMGPISEVLNRLKGEAYRAVKGGAEPWKQPQYDESWSKKYGENYLKIRSLLSDEEFNTAAASTRNAHYTDPEIVRTIWSMAARLGIPPGARILEPGAGVGYFVGMSPVANNANFTMVERDITSGRILKALYPASEVINKDMNKAKLANGTYDLVVGNVPFAADIQPDSKKRYGRELNLHNYFIARSLDALRPGGVAIIITTHNTLDSAGAQRELLAAKGNLIAAIRLPKTTFQANANTEVVTDILVLQRPVDPTAPMTPWRNTRTIETDNGKYRGEINEWIAANPDFVLGRHSMTGEMYATEEGKEYTLLPNPGQDLKSAVESLIGRLPQGITGERGDGPATPIGESDEGDGIPSGTVFSKNGEIWLKFDNYAIRWGTDIEIPDGYPKGLNASTIGPRAKDYIALRERYAEVRRIQNDPNASENEVNAEIASLSKLYDMYTHSHGPLGGTKTGIFKKDPEFYNVRALENVSMVPDGKGKLKPEYTKSDILNKRTMYPPKTPDSAETIEEAVGISIASQSAIDVPLISRLIKREPERVTEELLQKRLAFIDPETSELVESSYYLSGPVRVKLRKAEAAAEDDPRFEANVEALKAVVPATVYPSPGTLYLKSTFIPEKIIERWARSLLNESGLRVTYIEGADRWRVVGATGSVENNSVYGIQEISGHEILEKALNGSTIRIERTVKRGDGTKVKVFFEKETIRANEIREQIEGKWLSWIGAESNRDAYVQVSEAFNQKHNGWVAQKFDGSDIPLHGLSTAFRPRFYQRNAVARILRTGHAMLAHAVGAGKTLSMIMAAMEMRRLGKARRPMIVVQNATLGQFAHAFAQAYPSARIMVADSNDLQKDRRKAFLARIVSGDWDSVIIAQSTFDRLKMSPDAMIAFYNEKIDELIEALNQAGDELTTKEIERAIESAQRKIDDILDKQKKKETDDLITFEELGVDALFIDEAHAYKKPLFATKIGNIVGLNKEASAAGTSTLMKVRHIQSKTRGRNVVMATGTPVTNTFGEVWHMINFTAPDILRDAGVPTFDRFASTFGVIGQVLTTNAGGQPVFKSGFVRFTHRNEFSQLIRSAWDVLTPEDLRAYFEEDAAAAGKPSGLPTLRGGDVRPIVLPLSDGNAEFNDFVKRVYERWQDMPPRERRNYNWVAAMLYQASRAAAIDIRLIFPDAKEEENSILNTAAKNIYKEYVDSEEFKGTQMVFSDVNNAFNMSNLNDFARGISVGIAMEQEPEDEKEREKWLKEQEEIAREREVSGLVWSELIKKLVALGIPRDKIAIAAQAKTDAARKQLFDRMKSGDIRIMLGSTAKMGIGVNVQDLMIAQHQLDAPWLPADVEQRIGRIVRFGNKNQVVSVQRYAMEDTLSAGIYMAVARKARMIWQAMQGGGGTDEEFEDPASETSMGMDQVAALINKNPQFMRRLELQQIIRGLRLSQEGHTQAIQDIRNEIETALTNAEYRRKTLIPHAESNRDELTEIISRPIGAKINGVNYDDIKELGKVIEAGWLPELEIKARAKTKETGKEAYEDRDVPIYGGGITLRVYGHAKQVMSFDGTVRIDSESQIATRHGDVVLGLYKTVRGAVQAVENSRDNSISNIERHLLAIEEKRKRAAELTPQLSRPWERAKDLEAAEAELAAIDDAMSDAARRPATGGNAGGDQPGDSDMYSLPEDIPTPTRPELSQLSAQIDTRAQLAEADKTWSRQRRTEEEIAQQVQQRLQDDRAGERAKYDAFLRQPGKSFATWTDAEVAKVFMDEDATKYAKTNDPAKWGEMAERYHAWRDAGTAAGQILRARRDPLETPGQRWARVVSEALMTPADDRRKDMEDARKRVFDAQKGVENAGKSPAAPDPEELARLKAVLDAALAELDALKKRIGTEMLSLKERLAELGVDIDNLSENGYTRDSALRAVRLIASMRASWSDTLYEYWRNAILSGPLTQIVNVTGGIAHAGYHYLLKRPLEIQLQNAIATLGESGFAKFVDRITGGFVTATIGPPPAKHERLSVAREYRFIARGMAAGLVRGAMNAMITLSTETDEFEEQAQRSGRMTGGSGDMIGRAANVSISETPVLETINAVRALLRMPRMKPNAATSFLDYFLSGRNVRIPQRMIGAADVFVKSMVAEMEAHSRAYQLAQLSVSPGASFETIAAITENLVLDERNTIVWGPAYDFARFVAFQQEGGEAAQFVKSIGKRFQGNKYGRWLVPFNATPVNLLETGLRYSPLGTIGLLGDVRRNMRSGRPALEGVGQKAIEQFLAMATLLLIWLANDPEDPWITGATAAAQPEDERPAGAPPPFSFRNPLDGDWVSYSRIEPFATMLGTTVDAGFALRRSLEGDIEESATTAMKSMTGQMSSKTYLLQLGSLIKAFNSADTGGKLVEGAITFPHSFVPNAVRQPILKSEEASMQQDIRGTTTGERLASAAERLGQKSQLVGGQVPKFDKWGLPIERSTASLPWRLLIPADVQPGEPYAGDKFIRSWNLAAKRNGWQGDGWNPDIPRPYWTDSKGERHAMSDEQYSVYLGMRGELARYFFEDAGFDPRDPQEGDKDQVSKLFSKSTTLTNEFFKSRWEKGQADAVPTRKDIALAAASDAIRTLTDPLPTSLPPAMRGKQTYMEYRAEKIAEINAAREVLRKWKITPAEAEQRMTELEKIKDTIVISREWGDVKNDTRQRRKNLLMQRLQGS